MKSAEVKKRPTEHVHIQITRELEAYSVIRAGLRNPNVAEKLDPKGAIKEALEAGIEECQTCDETLANALATERRHYVQELRETDEGASPSCREGWLCPDSPTGVCDYEKGQDADCCDYCSFPDERK